VTNIHSMIAKTALMHNIAGVITLASEVAVAPLRELTEKKRKFGLM